MAKFLHAHDNAAAANNNSKVIAIPLVFSENSQPYKDETGQKPFQNEYRCIYN